MDLSRPCAAGMSFGSMTAVRVADLEARFKAVIAMSGAYPQHTNLKVPTLWMLGTEDRTIGTAGNAVIRSHHEKHEGPSYLLELKNGGHYSFTDMPKVNPNHGNAYSTAFLDVYVKGDKSSLAFLHKNRWPDELIWQERNAEKE
jgi:dienelactone hydrolase